MIDPNTRRNQKAHCICAVRCFLDLVCGISPIAVFDGSEKPIEIMTMGPQQRSSIVFLQNMRFGICIDSAQADFLLTHSR